MAQAAIKPDFKRFDGRSATQTRPVTLEVDVNRYAEGSCLITVGHTKVLCTASFENQVPKFLHRTGKGWLTAEYGLLPRSTHTRTEREAAKGKQTGRTQEIQRLIGRSLRAVVNTDLLGERTLVIDCDVLQADGGTRTAAITGAYVAVCRAVNKLMQDGKLAHNPITGQIAAISCGVLDGHTPVVDLCYEEDAGATADANYVLTSTGDVVEIQITAEKTPVDIDTMNTMYQFAKSTIAELALLQKEAIAKNS
jgi:ribonuclease PH